TMSETALRLGQPPMFDGKNPRADEWMGALEWYLQALEVDTTRYVVIAVTYLTGSARVWWQARHRELGGTPTWTTYTWETFCTELHRRFLPRGIESEARRRIADLRQGPILDTYIDTFHGLVTQIPTMSMADQIDRFTRGLKPNVQVGVMLANPITLEEA